MLGIELHKYVALWIYDRIAHTMYLETHGVRRVSCGLASMSSEEGRGHVVF
jgi:hypothetical protein